MTTGELILLLVVAALGGGGLGGIIVARINARAAATSKPHELTEARAHEIAADTAAFAAFMTEARVEISDLRRRLLECEEKHAAAATERVELLDRIAHLEHQLADLEDPRERP